MKKYLMIMGIISLFLIAACAQQPAANDVQNEADDPSGAVMEVPVPGNEVEETVVVKDESSMAESPVVEISMTARQWEFEPAAITVKEGQRVKLTIRSIDVAHGFALPDFGVSQRLEPGKTQIVEFTADKKGTYTFFCNVACGAGHRDMKGQLVVE